MLLSAIPAIEPPQWLVKNRKIRAAAVLCACLIGLNILVFFLAVQPASENRRTLEARYAELRKHHAEAVLFQKQKDLFAGFKDGIPGQKDMPFLVRELVQSARDLNLKPGAVTYDIPQPGSNGLSVLSFSFSAEGAYPALKRFIYEIEASSRLVAIQEVKLNSEKGLVKLQMKLMTYIKST